MMPSLSVGPLGPALDIYMYLIKRARRAGEVDLVQKTYGISTT